MVYNALMKILNQSKKVAVYLAGLFILSAGVALSIRSGLGVSPVSSLPYVISLILEVYVGRVISVVMILLVLTQIILLRKNFRPIDLCQIAFSVVFGYFVDFILFLTREVHVAFYLGSLALLMVSIFFLSLGIAVMMETGIAPLPFESMVAALTASIPGARFHILKIVMDSVFAVLALGLALYFFRNMQGVREGTILTALLVGKMIPFSRRIAVPFLHKIGIVKPQDV